MLDDPQNHVVSKSKYADQQALADAGETRVIFYLYQCFSRLNKVASKLKVPDPGQQSAFFAVAAFPEKKIFLLIRLIWRFHLV